MKIALGIEYNGARYHGWQKQPGTERTVQIALEKALSKVADEPIKVICAGRTDTGVHAFGQVVHFDTNVIRKEIAWVFGVNSVLPRDVRVVWTQEVADDFHARFSATARSYEYVILNAPNNSALLHSLVTWECRPLNTALMQQASQYLLGEHDFSSFRAAECQAKSPVRTIESINVTDKKPYIHVSVTANAFLHHMIRNIVGVLLEIGRESQPVEWMADVLQAKSRQSAARTAAANGLYLTHVRYPEGMLKHNVIRRPCYSS